MWVSRRVFRIIRLRMRSRSSVPGLCLNLIFNIMVYGIGIYEKGKYDTIKDLKAYRLWKSILQRCYSKKSIAKFPTYRGCKVCDEWIYFQNFAKWFYENYIEGY